MHGAVQQSNNRRVVANRLRVRTETPTTCGYVNANFGMKLPLPEFECLGVN
jgi:hypothetical protein